MFYSLLCWYSALCAELYPFPPVIQEVFDSLLKRNLRLPAGRPVELAVIGNKKLDIGGAHPLRHLPHLYVDVGKREYEVEKLLNGYRLSRTDVIDLSRLPFLQGQPVSANDVPDVTEIPPGLEVPHI